jgi:hypothetical protein
MEDYEDQIKYVCSHCGEEYDKKADCIACIRNCIMKKDYDTVTNVYRLSACLCGDTIWYSYDKTPAMAWFKDEPDKVYYINGRSVDKGGCFERLDVGEVSEAGYYNFYHIADEGAAKIAEPMLVMSAREALHRHHLEQADKVKNATCRNTRAGNIIVV